MGLAVGVQSPSQPPASPAPRCKLTPRPEHIGEYSISLSLVALTRKPSTILPVIHNLNDDHVGVPIPTRDGVEQPPEIRQVFDVEILDEVPSSEVSRDGRLSDNLPMKAIFKKNHTKGPGAPSDRFGLWILALLKGNQDFCGFVR